MVESRREKKTKNGRYVFNIYLIYTATQYILNTVFLLLYHYFLLGSGRNRPIANMPLLRAGACLYANASPLSCCFFTLETMKKLSRRSHRRFVVLK